MLNPIEDPWKAIRPIFEAHAATSSVEDFHQQVNVHFHAVESEIYDEIHDEMWDSLPRQYDLLATDVLDSGNVGNELRLLDVGCGTGLGTDLLLQTSLGKSITDVYLIDTAQGMLDRALARSKRWGRRVQAKVGVISDLPDQRFDVVLVCSVLHHIPFLADFLRDVAKRQPIGGVLLHFQDPNKDYQSDPDYLKRCAELRRWEEANRPSTAKKLVHRFNPVRLTKRILDGPPVDYMNKVNETLIAAGALRSPMTPEEIWTITDIHDSPGQSAGISLTDMRGWMDAYDLVSVRSYGFFGKLVSRVSKDMAVREAQLSDQKALNGRFLSAAWRKTR